MKRWSRKPLTLRMLILVFVLLAALATLGNSLVVAYNVQRTALIHSTLEANRAYAAKVASSIREFLGSARRNLAYSSGILANHFDEPPILHAEAMRLQAQDAFFNSIIIVDASGKVLQAYPDSLQIVGTTLRSEAVKEALSLKQPKISQAYESIAGNLVVLISQPITSPSGEYLGLVGGSVYILKPSVLHSIIGSHFQQEGTFAFVADANHRLLHHPVRERVGEVVNHSSTIEAALRGESGSMEVLNYQGVPMLAGYAQVPEANWAVVAQQPRDLSLSPLNLLMKDMLLGLIPASLLGVLAIWVGTLLITRPLRQLALSAEQLSNPETPRELQGIKTWYREAAAIRKALLTGVGLMQQKLGQLSQEAQSDALTGLANRRALGVALDALEQSGVAYSVLAVDIDHFKRVNDTWGHDAGDEALRRIAAVLRDSSRAGDLACRAGGEEFVLLLPQTSLETATGIAERIRETVALTQIPQVGLVTLSIGVADLGALAVTPEAVLKLADQRLYSAKQSGRNRVVGSDET
ncbi:GGDEF domain-containing protein [Pseudomonas sp. PDM23]|uniref:sensor domain-containing diguanylate cyclase n=1 Tax=unclassified Pseudomonas TaxID=196821 RepID=UPI00177F98C7|nr:MULTISPECIES: sensor domain-containing diguanylate cyclase [unclassified Pseudomonas]MBD9579277.1 GGDEF domain-containing protein [Pseudomonas sp. PDM23]MBD9672738.1 GGDEF domain-containing protein [Pseudomonas sp. PDM21]